MELMGQSYGATEFRARRGSRRLSMARLRRLLDLELGQGGFGGAGALFKAPSACGASQPRGSRAAVSNS